MKVAVIAHSGKTLDGGLPELRRVVDAAGISDPLWHEVPKSRKAPSRVRRVLDAGADLIFAWGVDGMVQQLRRRATRLRDEPCAHPGRHG